MTSEEIRRKTLREVLLVYVLTLLTIRGVVMAERSLSLPDEVGVLVPILFIYVPLWVLERRRLDPADYGLVLEGVWPALRYNLKIWALVFPPFLIANHFYQGLLFDREPLRIWPHDLIKDVFAYHLLYVALPEEFFYRGWMQGRLNQLWPRDRRLFGVAFGKGLWVTALLFTAGHSLVIFRWWHFSILVPALIFGWIRERSPNVLTSTVFHASCNILMVLLDTAYGVIPP